MMETDPDCITAPQIIYDQYQIDRRNITSVDFHKINKRTLLYIKRDKNTIFTDVITNTFLLFSTQAFEIIKKYEPHIPSKQIVLLDEENRRTEVYFLPLLLKAAPISENINDKQPNKLVLQSELIRDKNIFWVEGYSTLQPVISLDLAESLLRRGARGLHLTEVSLRTDDYIKDGDVR